MLFLDSGRGPTRLPRRRGHRGRLLRHPDARAAGPDFGLDPVPAGTLDIREVEGRPVAPEELGGSCILNPATQTYASCTTS